jgi:hypothetical protein
MPYLTFVHWQPVQKSISFLCHGFKSPWVEPMPSQTKLNPKRLTTTALACFRLLTLAPPPAHPATKDDGVVEQPHIVTCNFKQTPLRTALKEIYRGSGYETPGSRMCRM